MSYDQKAQFPNFRPRPYTTQTNKQNKQNNLQSSNKKQNQENQLPDTKESLHKIVLEAEQQRHKLGTAPNDLSRRRFITRKSGTNAKNTESSDWYKFEGQNPNVSQKYHKSGCKGQNNNSNQVAQTLHYLSVRPQSQSNPILVSSLNKSVQFQAIEKQKRRIEADSKKQKLINFLQKEQSNLIERDQREVLRDTNNIGKKRQQLQNYTSWNAQA